MATVCEENEHEGDPGPRPPRRGRGDRSIGDAHEVTATVYGSEIIADSSPLGLDSFGAVHRGLAAVQDVIEYFKFRSRFRDTTEEFRCLLRHFVDKGANRRCLRLVFDDDRQPEIGSNWLTLSLDGVEREAREAGRVTLSLDDNSFDAVFCIGIGRVSRPDSLVAEVRRVLRRSGEVWVHTPLCGPYAPPSQPHHAEYMRYTPDGLRILFESFDEIFASIYLPEGNSLRPCSFFYGLKPAELSPDSADLTH
ncbi:methyltransferase domain-containing protein [Thiorhodococcus minor]|uniref:Class I SAM-dependent methyltransferase n=1 Tax=Thiorhodococcus minor TaxID=57489 RepID=A0A6M0K1R0_9GAMM|nr:methyltransferase domain-containing protein [Thiorhodococcus minor]NEV62843.1 class I SAM-dependent methyltransferase [Thiorhodococcus minor]